MLETIKINKSTRINLRNFALNLLKSYGIYFAFIGFFVYLSFSSPHFLTTGNLITVMRQVSVSGILACGLTMILIQGDIDLSFGSLLTVIGFVIAVLQGATTVGGKIAELPLVLAFLISMLVGVIVALINGVIITRLSVNPFIITLGMMTILKGVALVISGGQSVSGLKANYASLGNMSFFGIPAIFIIFLIVALLSWFLLNKTRLGRYVYAIGGNVQAAYLSGVPIANIRIIVFVIMGVLTFVSAAILTSRLNSATPLAGDPYLMDVIAACVIGGTSLSGGNGNIPGTVLGVIFLGIINNGLNLMSVPSAYQYIAKGLIIAIAVIIDASKVKVEGQYVRQ